MREEKCALKSENATTLGQNLNDTRSIQSRLLGYYPYRLESKPLDMVLQARADFNNAIFREIATSACWVIWNTRKDVIFDNGQINIHLWKEAVQRGIWIGVHQGKSC